MKKRLTLLAAALLTVATAAAQTPAPVPAPPVPPPAAAAPEAEAPQYIRVEKTPTATQLQIAVVHLKKGNATLDLVGAVHIADEKFYHQLNRLFEGYDALLWEGIGGGKPPVPASAGAEEGKDLNELKAVPGPDEVKRKEAKPDEAAAAETEDSAGSDDTNRTSAAPPAPKAAKPERNLSGLHNAYIAGAKYLELAFQMNEVNYHKPNFVHADLSLEEFNALQDERKESLFTFALKAGFAASQSKKAKEPNSFRMLKSLVSGDKNGLKRELVGTLGSADDQMNKIAGDSVIVSDRNAKCLKVLSEQVAAGKKKLGIFYGAAHFPDMEKRLLADGWQHTGQDWQVAWDIPN